MAPLACLDQIRDPVSQSEVATGCLLKFQAFIGHEMTRFLWKRFAISFS